MSYIMASNNKLIFYFYILLKKKKKQLRGIVHSREIKTVDLKTYK